MPLREEADEGGDSVFLLGELSAGGRSLSASCPEPIRICV